MGFNLEDYEPVAPRLSRWLENVAKSSVVPRVTTTLIAYEPGKWCIFRTDLYEGEILVSTGHAYEEHTERGVNSTSFMENCETSSTGRALSNYGMAGSDPSKRPSREEMAKVVRYEGDMKITGTSNAPSEKQLWKYKSELKKAGLLPPLNIATMSKFEVSKAIEALVNGEVPAEPVEAEEPF
jgi:hypothetical protein